MLQERSWVPASCEGFIQATARRVVSQSVEATERDLTKLIEENARLYGDDCINLNPAGNVSSPKAERALSQGLGSRPSLGYPGEKYEMGLEFVEQIEIITAQLVAEVFGAKFVEIRVPSGAIANLYAFMATAKPGDVIIAPPPEIGGHVTHHAAGCAGLYGLKTVSAAVDPSTYSIDVAALRHAAHRLGPKLITIGGSLNLFPHPVREIRQIADEVGAYVLYDAAHMCGMIAGGGWQQPLEDGAHLMTMSTYKSLGGPPAGLIVTNDAELARNLDAIAFPGMTANADAGKCASLAYSLLDWKVHGRAYAATMAETARSLAEALSARDVPVFAKDRGFTRSHQFAVEAARYGGGQHAAKRLRRANILTSGIGLPLPPVSGDMNGLRLGTPEIARWGMRPSDMPQVADFIAAVLDERRQPEEVAADVTEFRRGFRDVHFVR